MDDESVETYQEDSLVYDDYGQYGDDQHYAGANTSLTVQGYEPGKGSDTYVLHHSHIYKLPTETAWKYSCTLCGNENVQKANIVRHVESVHFPNLF